MLLAGQVCLAAALGCAGLAAVLLMLGHFVGKGRPDRAKGLVHFGYLLVFATTALLTICIAIIIVAFFTSNYTLKYVAENHSTNTGSLAWLYKLSGLWSGREGSLLFWAWIISLYATFVAGRRWKEHDELSNVALSVTEIVQLTFLGVLVFSSSNNPFQATDAQYLTSTGQLIGNTWGMNVLLEHWAMTIHPPTLFIGYAGMTIPFAYAISALICNDPSKRWVELCDRITMFAWLFLGIGIGLGAVWAYAVLGWGGYWGWDPVENASLLPWLVGVALIHSFTIYRKRGGFKRWTVMCACIAFAAVVLGTFITRSGIVQSVHAFNGDAVSLALFLFLIIASLVAGIIGLIVRHKGFEASEDIESFASKNAAYYFNNVVMIVVTVVVAYLTVSSALPSWMPFGGQTIATTTYASLVRPIGILYCLLMGVCPMLKWGKTEGKGFWKRMRIPGICGAVVFALLMFVFVTQLYPIYTATIASGGTNGATLRSQGPSWYYNGLAVVGLATASLLFCNTVYLFVSGTKARKKKGDSGAAAFFHLFTKTPRQAGGYLTHLGVAIILVGLIGSSMYVRETSVNMDQEVGRSITCDQYKVTYESNASESYDNGNSLASVTFDVTDGSGNSLGEVTSSVYSVSATQQTKVNASIITLPLRDIFISYKGTDSTSNKMSLDVKVNPLIQFVWIGFAVMMIGVACSMIPRKRRENGADEEMTENDVPVDAAAEEATDAPEAKSAKEAKAKPAKEAKAEAKPGEKA